MCFTGSLLLVLSYCLRCQEFVSESSDHSAGKILAWNLKYQTENVNDFRTEDDDDVRRGEEDDNDEVQEDEEEEEAEAEAGGGLLFQLGRRRRCG